MDCKASYRESVSQGRSSYEDDGIMEITYSEWRKGWFALVYPAWWVLATSVKVGGSKQSHSSGHFPWK